MLCIYIRIIIGSGWFANICATIESFTCNGMTIMRYSYMRLEGYLQLLCFSREV